MFFRSLLGECARRPLQKSVLQCGLNFLHGPAVLFPC